MNCATKLGRIKMSKKNELSMKSILKWHRSLNHKYKIILWSFLALVFVILLVNLTIESIRTFDSDTSEQECNTKRIQDVRYALSLQEENSYLAFIYSFEKPIAWMLVAIGIAWILHGVGFHIIKR